MFLLYDRAVSKTLGEADIMYPRSRVKKALEAILLFEFINCRINFLTAVFIPKSSKAGHFYLGILDLKYDLKNENGERMEVPAIWALFIAYL